MSNDYATSTDVATYTGIALLSLPTDIARLISRASDLVDYATSGQIDQTDNDQTEAAQNAVCAQVEYWIQEGEEGEYEGRQIISKTTSKASVSYGAGGVAGGSKSITDSLAPRAKRFLFLAGLLNRGAALQ